MADRIGRNVDSTVSIKEEFGKGNQIKPTLRINYIVRTREEPLVEDDNICVSQSIEGDDHRI